MSGQGGDASGLAGEPTERGHFRPDIEGLRAIAIGAVLLYHMGLPGVPGGFVGVDIFYVISGYLITGLLRRELVATGRVNLRSFYARRARRLLPAALLVIATTLAASWVLLSRLRFPDVAGDAAAAALYVSNYRFAINATDYLAQGNAPSPLLHYWSLAVEEQFYLVWPLLIIGAARMLSLRSVAYVVGVAGLASLALSVVATDAAAPWAFFSLPTRAWELAVGGGLALGVLRLPRRSGALIGAVGGWAGLLLILGSVLLIDGGMPFPGLVAIVPVAGAALVIASGERSDGPDSGTGESAHLRFFSAPGPLAPTNWLGRRFPRWLGRISYSLYLWHWPVLILVPIALGNDDVVIRVALGGVAVVLAVLSTRFIEAPFRVGHGPLRRPGLSIGFSGASSLLLAAVALAAGGVFPFRALPDAVAAGPRASGGVAAGSQPTGAAVGHSTSGPSLVPVTTPTAQPSKAAEPSGGTGTTAPVTEGPTPPALPEPILAGPLPADLQPPLASARDDVPAIYATGCHVNFVTVSPPTCIFGDVNAATNVVLFGDSHAAQWFPALDRLAHDRHWRLVTFTKSGCPPPTVTVWLGPFSRVFRECDAWRQAALSDIASLKPDLVVVSSAREYQLVDASGRHALSDVLDEWRAGLSHVLTSLVQVAPRVVFLTDTPSHAADPLECLSQHGQIDACEQSRGTLVDPAYSRLETESAQAAGARAIATTDWLCDATTCPLVVGNYLVYRDQHHLTATFAALLTEQLGWALDHLP